MFTHTVGCYVAVLQHCLSSEALTHQRKTDTTNMVECTTEPLSAMKTQTISGLVKQGRLSGKCEELGKLCKFASLRPSQLTQRPVISVE